MQSYSPVTFNAGTRCTIQGDGGRFCDGNRAPDMPFAICASHALRLYRRMREMLEEVQGKHHEHPDLYDAMVQQVVDQNHARDNAPLHRVYYVRVGNLIKIGTTGNLRQRLNAYPPGSELLASEPGGTDLEARRHRQFRHLLAARNEWFRPGGDLMDHIAALSSTATVKAA